MFDTVLNKSQIMMVLLFNPWKTNEFILHENQLTDLWRKSIDWFLYDQNI